MDPVTLALMAGGTLAPVVGGIIGNLTSAEDRARAERIILDAVRNNGNITAPELERVVAEQLGPSAFESIQSDPSVREAQVNALGRLGQVLDSGGMTAMDQAIQNRFMNKANRAAAGNRAAMFEQMNAKGMGNSGAMLEMMRRNAQDINQGAYDQALDTSANAQKRYLDTILARGGMAGNIRGQDFGEASAVAGAKDSRDRFNTGSRERASYYNAGLGQRDFDNRMRARSGNMDNARLEAGVYGGRADRAANMWQGIGSGVGNAMGSAAGYGASQGGFKDFWGEDDEDGKP